MAVATVVRADAGVDQRLGWLAITRVIYAGGMLAWWRPADLSPLADVPDHLWFAPLGPFALLDGPPPAWFLAGLHSAILVLLCLTLVGWRSRMVGWMLSSGFVIAAGLRFSTGKIDHDLVLWLVPAILGGSWGCRLALRPEPDRAPRLDVLSVSLGVTFLTAGLSKAFSGWLSPGASSVEGWARGYVDVYGWADPVASRVVDWPLPWELLDVATVLVECGLVFLLARGRTAPVGVGIAALFNLGVLAIMAIDFSQLVLVYLPLLPLSARVPRRLRWSGAVGVLAAVLVATPALALVEWRHVVAAALLAATVVVAARAALTAPTGGTGWVTRRRAIGWTLAMLATYPLVVVGAEPFPALTGPMFWGDGPSERQVWEVDGVEVPVSRALGLDPRWATNVGLAGWPAAERGHELGRLWYHPDAVLPADVSVDWVRSR